MPPGDPHAPGGHGDPNARADGVGQLPAARVRSEVLWRTSPSLLTAATVLTLGAVVLVLAAAETGRAPSGAVVPSMGPTAPVTLGESSTMTVSEFLKASTDGTLPDTVTLTGYWSGAPLAHSCAPTVGSVGELEIPCHDGEYGITELAEHIITITPSGYSRTATGAWITPLIDDARIAASLFGLPRIHGQQHPPVPIVAIGHVNDPRAAECRAAAHQLCRDRFVIDEVVEFEPEAVPAPAVTPAPTPFPFGSPPPALFAAQDCAGDVVYSFAGWTRLQDLEVESTRDEVAFVVVTRDVITTEWMRDDQDPSRHFRSGGRRYCYATEGMGSTIRFGGYLPGTGFIEYDDGTKKPIG